MSIALVNIGRHVAAEEIDLVWFSQIYRADFGEGGGRSGVIRCYMCNRLPFVDSAAALDRIQSLSARSIEHKQSWEHRPSSSGIVDSCAAGSVRELTGVSYGPRGSLLGP